MKQTEKSEFSCPYGLDCSTLLNILSQTLNANDWLTSPAAHTFQSSSCPVKSMPTRVSAQLFSCLTAD